MSPRMKRGGESLSTKRLIRQVLRAPSGTIHWLGWFSVADSPPRRFWTGSLKKRHTSTARRRDGRDRHSDRIAGRWPDRCPASRLRSPTRIVFAGDTMSGAALRDIVEIVKSESVMLNVIAKDFNTLEPGIAFPRSARGDDRKIMGRLREEDHRARGVEVRGSSLRWPKKTAIAFSTFPNP